MRNIIIIILFFGALTIFKAQTAFKGLGDQKLQIGANAFGYGAGVVASYSYGINDWLSIGGGTEIYFGNDDDNFFIYGKMDAHLGDLLNLPNNMDLYPGINLGGRNDGFGIGVHLGYRYFFNNNLGAFAEIGSHGALGIVINL